jgi:hypothetical protein
MTTGMSLREYARYRGVTLSSVQVAIASGRIRLLRNGRVDPVEADRAWTASTHPAPRGARKGSQPKETPSFAEARARREHIRAEREAIELARMKGELVPASDVARQAFARSPRTGSCALVPGATRA